MKLKTINAENVVCPKTETEIKIRTCEQCKSHGGTSLSFSEVICKYKQYEDAPEVQEIASKLIQEHHTHLVEAKILYLFRFGSWKVSRKEKIGNTEKCSAKTKHLTGADFIITINAETWPYMDSRAKVALVDHELCHCGSDGHDADGKPIWYMVPHTIQDFAAVLRRHGLWDNDSVMVARAMAESGLVQTELFKDDQNGLKLVSSNQ